MVTVPDRRPWEHEGVRVVGGRLLVAGRDAEALAREHGTPLYAFDVTRVAEQARALRDALARADLTPRVRLALKAQRAPEILAALRALGAPGSPGAVGIDACSPGEVRHALDHGFTAAEISFTGTNVSERDLDVIAPAGVHVNLDLLSQIERYGRRCPGRTIGLRVNPRGGVMRGHAESLYSGARPTKFGIYEEDLGAALEAARRHGLIVDTLHVHLANGMLDDELPAFDAALEPVTRMAETLLDAGCPLQEVNVGGGLGTPLHAGERPLDLDAYAGILARRFGGARRRRRRGAGRVPHQRVRRPPRRGRQRRGAPGRHVRRPGRRLEHHERRLHLRPQAAGRRRRARRTLRAAAR